MSIGFVILLISTILVNIYKVKKLNPDTPAKLLSYINF